MGELEQKTRLARGGEAYGLQIHDQMCEMNDKRVNLGGMNVTPDRLQKKDFLSSRNEPGTEARGGKPRRFYRLESAGAVSELW